MKTISLILFTSLLVACNSKPKIAFDAKDLYKTIQSDKNYYTYYYKRFSFNDSSLYFNQYDSLVNDLSFFKELSTGFYFPIKSDNNNAYKLFKVEKWPIDEINGFVRGLALQQIKRISLINKVLLSNPMKDLNNKIIDSNSIKDKIVFVKFWFIHCNPCVQEMPELNTLVHENKNRKDVLFLSFAHDKPADLRKFLAKTTFNYTIISADRSYIFDTLGIEAFPTHLLVQNNRIKRILKGPPEISEILKNHQK